MNLLVVGHSMISYRQYACTMEIARQRPNWKILVIAPKKWITNEKVIEIVKDNFRIKGLEIGYFPKFDSINMYTFVFPHIVSEIQKFKPNLIFCGEPFTALDDQINQISKLYSVPYGCITWENRINLLLPKPFDSFEKQCIEYAKFIMCGTEDAKQRMINRGTKKSKLVVCPHSGVDTNIYKPDDTIEKEYDIGFIGRFVKCKGVEIIDKVAEKLKLRMLWVGGRGDYEPKYGDVVEWNKHEDIIKYYNKIKIMMTLPYPHDGYSEQFAYPIPESLSCGTPVIHTDNGSLGKVYENAPTIIIPDYLVENNNIDAICKIVETTESIFDSQGVETVKNDCRQWILDNLSNEKIAEKQIKIFEDAIEK